MVEDLWIILILEIDKKDHTMLFTIKHSIGVTELRSSYPHLLNRLHNLIFAIRHCHNKSNQCQEDRNVINSGCHF